MKKILVLMSTYNGEAYLEEQLKTIFNQTGVKISVLVRDDGSKDKTLEILENWSKSKKLNYYQGKNLKPAKSFMDLIMKAPLNYDYYAFSDQDDAWDTDKMKAAISFFDFRDKKPSLYISGTRIVDKDLNVLSNNKIYKNITFENEIIKNEATGCTEVLNTSLLRKLKKYNPRYIKMHDSWVCRVCLAIGGNVYIDDVPHISYRQHANNVVGYRNSNFLKLKEQFVTAFKKNERIRQLIAIELLKGYKDEITEKNLKILNELVNYPENFNDKIKLLSNSKFKTPYKSINLKMYLAILLNKF